MNIISGPNDTDVVCQYSCLYQRIMPDHVGCSSVGEEGEMRCRCVGDDCNRVDCTEEGMDSLGSYREVEAASSVYNNDNWTKWRIVIMSHVILLLR